MVAFAVNHPAASVVITLVAIALAARLIRKLGDRVRHDALLRPYQHVHRAGQATGSKLPW